MINVIPLMMPPKMEDILPGDPVRNWRRLAKIELGSTLEMDERYWGVRGKPKSAPQIAWMVYAEMVLRESYA